MTTYSHKNFDKESAKSYLDRHRFLNNLPMPILAEADSLKNYDSSRCPCD